MGNDTIGNMEEEKDLSHNLNNLSPEKQINRITRETYRLLSNIRVALHCMDEDRMKKLIESVIRSRLEYTSVLCFSTQKEKQ